MAPQIPLSAQIAFLDAELRHLETQAPTAAQSEAATMALLDRIAYVAAILTSLVTLARLQTPPGAPAPAPPIPAPPE